MKQKIQKIILLLLAVLFCIYISLPFFDKGFFQTQDGEWAIIRLAEMKRELKDGQFPPRWSDYLNRGFGYPLFNFAYPLVYILGSLISFAGLGLTDTIKILFIAGNLFACFYMFALGKKLSNEWGGFFSALLYLSFPYRLVNLYQRGSLGEIIGAALFPAVIYHAYIWIKGRKYKDFFLASAFFSFLALSHNASFLIFVPLFLVFLVIMSLSMHYSRAESIYKVIVPLFLYSFFLAAFFLIPAAWEKSLIRLSLIPLADKSLNFIDFSKIITGTDGYLGGLNIHLGLGHYLGIIISCIAFLFSDKLIRRKNIYLFFFVSAGFTVYLWLSNRISLPIWEGSFLKDIDFPWRVFNIIGLFAALFACFAVQNKIFRTLMFAAVIIALVNSKNMIITGERIYREDAYYETNDDTTTSANELMPLWVTNDPRQKYSQKVEVTKGQALLDGLEYNSRSLSFQTQSNNSTEYKINTIYYPGWSLYINGQKSEPDYSQDGLIKFSLSDGRHSVRLVFEKTIPRLLSEIISITAWTAGFIFLFIKYARSKK